MRKRGIASGLMALLILTTGCWDQDSLKDARLANASAYDITSEGKIKQTLEIVDDSESQQGTSDNEIHSGTGRSVRQSTDTIRAKVTGDIRFFKYGMILYGNKLAQNDIYPYLDVLYREPDYPTSHVKIAIVDGAAGDLLNQKRVGRILIGEFMTKKMKSLEELCIFPAMTLETLLPPMLDPGQDFALPYLYKDGEEIAARGIALFHGQRFTGSLNVEQGPLYVIMSGKWNKTARFVKKIHSGSANDPRNYVTYEAKTEKIKRKLAVHVNKDNQIDVNLRIQLPVNIVEYPMNHLQQKGTIEHLNRELSEAMTRDAEMIVQTLQRSGCDSFGIGRQLIAHYPDFWKRLNWNKEYAQVRFHPEVTVKVVANGVLN
ncbi:Ger(x)C family spore germination protein [Paenibacillus sp. JNUCC31]|uniref:Ger(x)C family spore germination protein n=1 Tax=Paenibacillus sp. JNUCC-31 TaxID=2777983 RepID=UPI001783D1D0|nr:Ger(x)C family spore germination protein [Paenibacillus sp. JNUCC-31]QOS78926.1 Ger(x)C family spore germination protein [Paenibacillus sp. JNUCC-31]